VADVLLSNDDITVLGPPETVEVLVDIGPSGTRGSQVFVGIGDPNVVEIGQTPILNDLYINTSPGTNYGYLSQYVSQPGGNSWIEILRINPTIYSKNYSNSYASGESQIIIPIADIVEVTGTPLTADNFSIRYSIDHDNPVSSSMSIPALVGDGSNLVINFKAVEHRTDVDSGPYGDWALLNAVVTTHLLISVILSDEES
jgi:hypothetical protein